MQLNHPLDPQTLGQLITERLGKHSREELAAHLGVDSKTLLKWEQGLVTRIHLAHRQRLHEVLDLPLELLNMPNHFTAQGARQLHTQLPSLLDQGAYMNAEQVSEILIQGCRAPGNQRQRAMRSILARASYLYGLAKATLTDKPWLALPSFERMGRVADELRDSNGLAIALTYRGEMYRRMGEMHRRQGHQEKASHCLEQARLLLEAALELARAQPRSAFSTRVTGNGQQLLARVYLARGEHQRAFDTLRLAEERAADALPQDEEDWYVPFCLCGVMVELAKSQMLVKRYDDSFATLARVRRLVPDAPPRWAIPSTLTEGELLLRFARAHTDLVLYKEGTRVLLQGYTLACTHHHRRQQQRVQRLLTRWSTSDATRMEYTYQLQEGVRRIDEAGGEEAPG